MEQWNSGLPGPTLFKRTTKLYPMVFGSRLCAGTIAQGVAIISVSRKLTDAPCERLLFFECSLLTTTDLHGNKHGSCGVGSRPWWIHASDVGSGLRKRRRGGGRAAPENPPLAGLRNRQRGGRRSGWEAPQRSLPVGMGSAAPRVARAGAGGFAAKCQPPSGLATSGSHGVRCLPAARPQLSSGNFPSASNPKVPNSSGRPSLARSCLHPSCISDHQQQTCVVLSFSPFWNSTLSCCNRPPQLFHP